MSKHFTIQTFCYSNTTTYNYLCNLSAEEVPNELQIFSIPSRTNEVRYEKTDRSNIRKFHYSNIYVSQLFGYGTLYCNSKNRFSSGIVRNNCVKDSKENLFRGSFGFSFFSLYSSSSSYQKRNSTNDWT